MNTLLLANDRMPRLISCGHLTAHEPFFHADRIADFHVLIFGINGTIYVTEDETDFEVSGGDLFFLKSGVHHYGKYETQRGTEWYFAHFETDEAEGSGSIELPKKLSGMQQSKAARIFSELINCSSSPEHKWYENALLFYLLSETAFYHKKSITPHTVSDEICEYLTKNYAQRFSAAELEEHFYLSYKHMAFLFKREKGLTMQQFHTNVRMEQAQRLLRSTLMSIGEIAHAVGYSDMLYFSRMFRRRTGMSPTAYRRRPYTY